VENPDKERESKRKCKYGMSNGQWNALFESQGNKCAICGATEPGSKQHWHTDHAHDTDKVRGILYGKCNHALGLFKDKRAALHAADAYLARYEQLELDEPLAAELAASRPSQIRHAFVPMPTAHAAPILRTPTKVTSQSRRPGQGP
jgi:hypothetical protein